MSSFVLPFRGEQFSFTLNSKAAPDGPALADLAAVVFDRQGQFLDVVHTHKTTALKLALASAHDPKMWAQECQPLPGDDVIHVLPKRLDPSAEVIILVASVPLHPGRAQDLCSPPKLEFITTFTESGNTTALTQSKVMDLAPAASAASASGCGQSIIVAVAYLDQPGWTLKYDLTGSPLPTWALMIPDLQAAILRVTEQAQVDLDSGKALKEDPPSDTAVLCFSRLHDDMDLHTAARFRLPEAPTPTPEQEATAAAAAPPPQAAGGSGKEGGKKGGEGGEAVPVVVPLPFRNAPVTKLRVDVGWRFWGRVAEDEIEGNAVEFAIKFYNALGEEVQSASTTEREVQGVVVGRPEPEEQEEEEAEPEPEEEEGEEGEGGEEGEEGAEPKEPPPPPPEPAEDPYEFKQRDVAFIELKELPKDVRSFVILVTNYAETGFLPLRHAGVKLWDVSGGEEVARPIGEWQHYSKFEAEAEVTQVAFMKVYKEYKDSAWNMWKGSGLPNVEEFVHGDRAMLKEVMLGALKAAKEFKAKEAAALAAAEEAGEELEIELRESTWRYAVLGLAMGGQSTDEAEHDIKNNILNYDGPLKALTARTSECARVQFGGEKLDTYFGGYQEDLKSGPGIYVFAAGAFYIGDFKGGKREGKGVMLMPDEGYYEGEFAADRFHGPGQYRYPDGSVYTGSWAEGKKHGPGVYWDTSKGCLRGSWFKGILQGSTVYDQPAVHYEGMFVAGVPAGECQFTVTSHRTLDLHKFAAAHILDNGPTLKGPGQYAIPPGSGEEPKLDEEGQPIEDLDKPPLPVFPKYEGLGFQSTGLPLSIADMAFPPKDGLPVPIEGVPSFSVSKGLAEATAA